MACKPALFVAPCASPTEKKSNKSCSCAALPDSCEQERVPWWRWTSSDVAPWTLLVAQGYPTFEVPEIRDLNAYREIADALHSYGSCLDSSVSIDSRDRCRARRNVDVNHDVGSITPGGSANISMTKSRSGCHVLAQSVFIHGFILETSVIRSTILLRCYMQLLHVKIVHN